MELVTKPCTDSDVIAAAHLKTPLRPKKHACDENTDTFYHSLGRLDSPYLTIQLNDTYKITKIIVVNVHTGQYCLTHAEDCTKRIDGAKVEVLTAGIRLKRLKKCYRLYCI